MLYIPVDRFLSIMESIQFTIKNLPYTTTPNLSKLRVGKYCKIKTRNLHKIIQEELTWDRRIRLYENDKANQ